MPTPLALFLLQAALILGIPYALWRIRGVGHVVPLVVVQIAVGMVLGPSVLGVWSPQLWAALFPPATLQALNGLVWLSVTFFAFATGLHFDLAELGGRGRSFAAAAAASVAVPTALGAAAGWALWALAPGAVGAMGGRVVFAAGMGVAAGVTALPVLGAVLRELHLSHTRLGGFALGCAAVNDAALWVLMAGVLALAGNGSTGGSAWDGLRVLGGAVLFGAVMALAVRPLAPALFRHALLHGRINDRDIMVLVLGMLGSALAAELIGIHAIVGAFAFGTVVPKAVARDALARFESFVTVVLLPFFFIATGLKTRLDLEGGAGLVFVVMTVVSAGAKIGAGALVTRLAGWPARQALAFGSLVSCKGLMEVVVLTLLAEAGVLSPAGFGGMVLMALATTALAMPLARLALNGCKPD